MTRETQLKCSEDNREAFKKMVLAEESKIPPNGDSMEIRQWLMGLRERRLGDRDG